jgi:Tetratricopeptide repeat
VGFFNINSVLIDQLTDWLIKRALKILDDLTRNKTSELKRYPTVLNPCVLTASLSVSCCGGGGAKVIQSVRDERSLLLKMNLGRLYYDRGSNEEALPLFLECYETRQQKHGPRSLGTLQVGFYLSQLYLRLGRLDEAEVWDRRHFRGCYCADYFLSPMC